MLEIIAYNYGSAAGDSGTRDGASCLLSSALLQACESRLHELDIPGHSTGTAALADVAILNDRLATLTARAVASNDFFLTLGGDHSCAIGSWSGASAATPRLGLLWVDAHLDSHTPESSETQNIHGMPVAALLGEGDDRLCATHHAGAKVKGEDLCIFAARSFEPAEVELLKKHNVRVFEDSEINARGFDVCLQEALQIISANTSAIGLSLDVDGIDPVYAPAVGTPADGGLNPEQVMAIIAACKQHNWLGLEIAEFNPHNDIDQRTEKLLLEIIARAL
jgi:arginase